MKKFESANHLPSAPTLIGSAEFAEVRAIIASLSQGRTSTVELHSRWSVLQERYIAWERSFPGLHTSTTNRKLQLYELLLEAFPELPIKNDQQLLNVVLSSLPAPGQKITTPEGEMEVMRREITARLGVLLTLKNRVGDLVSREIFD